MGGGHGLDRAEEEPARSRRAGRRPDGPHVWQDPDLAAAAIPHPQPAVPYSFLGTAVLLAPAFYLPAARAIFFNAV